MNTFRLLAAATLAALTWTLAGCGDDDELVAQETAADCIVTTATMGTLNRTIHTLDRNGNDSTYQVTVQGSLYPLSIDNVNGRIFNADSLPVGTNVKRVAFSNFTTAGISTIRSLTSGLDSTFTYTDSTDFSTLRHISIYARNGQGKRTYAVDIRLHKEEPDSFRWTRTGAADPALAALARPRLLIDGDRLLAFGSIEGGPAVLAADRNAHGTWTRTDLAATGLETGTVTRMNGRFYALAGRQLLTSADGIGWEPAETAFRPEALVAAGSDRLHALADGKLYASTDGTNWTEEEADEPEELPDDGFAACHLPASLDPQLEYVLLVGRRAGKAVVWRLTTDLTGTERFPWTFLPAEEDNPYPCPALEDASLVAYDGMAVLVGTQADGTGVLLASRDLGRTWKTGLVGAPPSQGDGVRAAATDDEQFLWVITGGTGEVWKGRYNRLGWADGTAESGL